MHWPFGELEGAQWYCNLCRKPVFCSAHLPNQISEEDLEEEILDTIIMHRAIMHE